MSGLKIYKLILKKEMRKMITIDRMNSMLKYPGFNICSNNDFNAIYYNGKSKNLLRDKKRGLSWSA